MFVFHKSGPGQMSVEHVMTSHGAGNTLRFRMELRKSGTSIRKQGSISRKGYATHLKG
jgi:hypothetical protein